MTKQDLNDLRNVFETELDEHIRLLQTPIEMLKPMIYSLKGGGKRLRPLLLLAILNAESEKHMKKGATTAVALEFIHTYSLIHDDLPAMDNDDLRRGQPTAHIKFDEATAILAGDALLTDAFSLISDDSKLKSKQKVKIMSLLSSAAGSHGMVAGQLGDMQAENKEITLEELNQIHEFKTGKLFTFATQAAAIIGEFSPEIEELLVNFGETFGVLYQIHNDLLDVIDDSTLSGKGHSSDEFNKKSTYPNLLGLEESKEVLGQEREKAEKIIEKITKLSGTDYSILNKFLSFTDID
ncbi:polyprenyl synthetase family protein [Ruoffia tabacinasalis]|jgi:geranylgeranyl diphosphate synthase type II|uniref:Polyprenyl synthetase family protein n=1 Tax=Ruoffia tabacinasalis TaxID=87458 RepID=A0ABS0LJW1_9LACT|nr:farnesyl diphosphate synthase [Ruoffia tabacinasalis]MBG9978382.1 polyprenyl synthetase family protein [Ruoffia tabacinasalis]